MTGMRVRLWLAAGLFVAWLGFLGYLVMNNAPPTVQLEPEFQLKKRPTVVVSRPQLLAADYVIAADVAEGQLLVKNVEILMRQDSKRKLPEFKDELEVGKLDSHFDTDKLDGQIIGWNGAGRYVIPLSFDEDLNGYVVTGIPRSPGFSPREKKPRIVHRIYPDTPQTREQLK